MVDLPDHSGHSPGPFSVLVQRPSAAWGPRSPWLSARWSSSASAHHSGRDRTLTYTKLLPGSTVVQVVAYLGYKLSGWPGSAVATVAFVFPSALMMLVLAADYVSVTAVPAMRPAITGLTAAVVGLLLATTYRLGKANIPDRITLGIALVSLGAGAVLGISAAVIVVVAGLLGVGLYALLLRPQAMKEGHAMILDLFTRCVLISLLAFGGGQVALPLIERIAVGDTLWLSPQDFATAVAFGYVTPGPVLITMTFLWLPGRRDRRGLRGNARHFPHACGRWLPPPRSSWHSGSCSIRGCSTLAGRPLPPWWACSSSPLSLLAAPPLQAKCI